MVSYVGAPRSAAGVSQTTVMAKAGVGPFTEGQVPDNSQLLAGPGW
jgi:hypothetical protein